VWENGGVFYEGNFEIQLVEFGEGPSRLRIFDESGQKK